MALLNLLFLSVRGKPLARKTVGVWVCLFALIGMGAKGQAQDLPWHLGSIHSATAAPAAINTAGMRPGQAEVVVAVIDGGILAQHPSLSDRLLPGYDMVSGANNVRGGRSPDFGPDPRDAKCGADPVPANHRTHGTEVASLIAGNGFGGVMGVNPNARILPVRLFGACGTSRSDLLDALAWAAGWPVQGVPPNPHPARVINLSFTGGRTTCGSDLQHMLDQMARENIFVVAAAGNTYGKPLSEPANCRGVISVGAVDAENNIEKYSSLDPRITIYAPGGGQGKAVDAPWNANKLKVATLNVDPRGNESPVGLHRGVGTSFAAPLVSGFVALILSHNPDMTPQDFVGQLSRYSRPVNKTPGCPQCSPRSLAMAPAM